MNRSTQFPMVVRGFATPVRRQPDMLQFIGLVAVLIATMLIGPAPRHGGPFGVSGGGPVGHPHPRPTPTAFPQVPNLPH